MRDTLLHPLSYDGKYIITNPPYLARNKSKDKTIFDKYHENDLYKFFIKLFLNTDVLGGLIIVPLNMFCSVRTADIKLRKDFLASFKIVKFKMFKEQVKILLIMYAVSNLQKITQMVNLLSNVAMRE